MISRRLALQIGSVAALRELLANLGVQPQSSAPADATVDDIVRLDANENPAGPPQSAIEAMVRGASATSRYHFEEFAQFAQTVAASESLAPQYVLCGSGSSELIDAAIHAFTSVSRPMILATPTYEIPTALAQSLGRGVVRIPLTDRWAFPVQKMAEAAQAAGGGLLYLCNPNNPTASLTPASDILWLATHLPPNTVLLVDEAYFDFVDPRVAESAIGHVRAERSVIVTRTFSKLYGMAGARVGFCCGRPDLIKAMSAYRTNITSVLGLRAATAALAERATLVPSRRATVARIRRELCAWLDAMQVGYIESHANFVMIDIGRDAGTFGAKMLNRGVAVGRPFPPLNRMMRVTLGTDAEMAIFREAFQLA